VEGKEQVILCVSGCAGENANVTKFFDDDGNIRSHQSEISFNRSKGGARSPIWRLRLLLTPVAVEGKGE